MTQKAERVYLVRHGSVSYFDANGQPLDPRNVELNPIGVAQAQVCAELLAQASFTRIVCSGLARTVQTAQIIRGQRMLEIEQEPALKEIRGGRFREIPAQEHFKQIAHAYSTAGEEGAQFIGGERFVDFATRVLEAFTGITQTSSGDVLLVVHDAVIRVILAHITGAGLAGLRAFEQDPAALSILDRHVLACGTSSYVLRAVNVAGYDVLRLNHRDTVMERVWRSYQAG